MQHFTLCKLLQRNIAVSSSHPSALVSHLYRLTNFIVVRTPKVQGSLNKHKRILLALREVYLPFYSRNRVDILGKVPSPIVKSLHRKLHLPCKVNILHPPLLYLKLHLREYLPVLILQGVCKSK